MESTNKDGGKSKEEKRDKAIFWVEVVKKAAFVILGFLKRSEKNQK